VCVGVFSALGLCALFGIPFSPLHLQVLPFLALGMGVNDMFVYAATFRFDPRKSVGDMAGSCLRECGPSVSMAALANTVAFFIGAAMPLPNAAWFSLAAAVVVVTNYFILMLGFTAMLCVDAKNVKQKTSISSNEPLSWLPWQLPYTKYDPTQPNKVDLETGA